MAEQLRRSPDSSWPTVPPSCPISGRRSIGSTLLPDPARRAARARVVRRQQTGIFTQRNDGSQAGFTRVVTDYATFGPSSSLIRWWLHLHRWKWKTSAAASPARLVAQADRGRNRAVRQGAGHPVSLSRQQDPQPLGTG
jgi:hypothetical protein